MDSCLYFNQRLGSNYSSYNINTYIYNHMYILYKQIHMYNNLNKQVSAAVFHCDRGGDCILGHPGKTHVSSPPGQCYLLWVTLKRLLLGYQSNLDWLVNYDMVGNILSILTQLK